MIILIVNLNTSETFTQVITVVPISSPGKNGLSSLYKTDEFGPDFGCKNMRLIHKWLEYFTHLAMYTIC